jgi:hypothetical protein
MKIAITGSRNWADADLIAAELEKLNISELLHGGAMGADTLAATWAERQGIPTRVFLPDYPKHGKRATHIRNWELVQAADGVVAFWDGASKGTQSTIDKARKAGKLISVVNQP